MGNLVSDESCVVSRVSIEANVGRLSRSRSHSASSGETNHHENNKQTNNPVTTTRWDGGGGGGGGTGIGTGTGTGTGTVVNSVRSSRLSESSKSKKSSENDEFSTSKATSVYDSHHRNEIDKGKGDNSNAVLVSCSHLTNLPPNLHLTSSIQRIVDHWHLSRSELLHFYRVFTQLDVDESQTIDPLEFFLFLREPRTRMMNSIIPLIVQHGDEKHLNFSEWLVAVFGFCFLTDSELLEHIFHHYDSSRVGRLSKNDLFKFIKHFHSDNPLFPKDVVITIEGEMDRSGGFLDFYNFRLITQQYEMLCYPVYHIQEKMRQKIVGKKLFHSLDQRTIDIYMQRSIGDRPKYYWLHIAHNSIKIWCCSWWCFSCCRVESEQVREEQERRRKMKEEKKKAKLRRETRLATGGLIVEEAKQLEEVERRELMVEEWKNHPSKNSIFAKLTRHTQQKKLDTHKSHEPHTHSHPHTAPQTAAGTGTGTGTVTIAVNANGSVSDEQNSSDKASAVLVVDGMEKDPESKHPEQQQDQDEKESGSNDLSSFFDPSADVELKWRLTNVLLRYAGSNADAILDAWDSDEDSVVDEFADVGHDQYADGVENAELVHH